jgi:hypothetical protein
MTSAAYAGFRRQAVPAQVAQKLQTLTIPAPTRGLVLNENESYMQPGAALVLDNWLPTMKGCKIRGGHILWSTLPETTPVISMFNFVGANQQMFAGNQTKLYNVTGSSPSLIASGQTSGNYVASQLANQSGEHMLVCNEGGDYVLHYDGTTWTKFNGSQINADPAITPAPTCINGHNLTYVWKYRNRFFFIEGGTMNAWYLPTNAFQGRILQIPLAGATTKGGHLVCGFTWSLDAGDGIDDKCVFYTSEGEAIIFTGSDPSTATNWRQEGRYAVSKILGMNAHQAIGGDVLLATVDGMIPISSAISKDPSQLELASVTRAIKPMWRREVDRKRAQAWTMFKWDEFGAMFVAWPGGTPGDYTTGVVNIATGAWARITGWDAMCFGRLGANMFFGTQAGTIMQTERSGKDNGAPYVATLVGGWEMFSSQASTIVWRQARAQFSTRSGGQFYPQISACTDYVINVPIAPTATPDPGTLDVWDQGVWGPTPGFTPPWSPSNPLPPQVAPTVPEKDLYTQWDQPAAPPSTVINTQWVSIGYTGFSHAPVIQVTISQTVAPDIEFISMAATYDGAGVNV